MEDNRNVIDHYKYWADDAIKAALDTKRLPFNVICENFQNDFNIATTIRNANAFTAKEIWIIGQKKWDKRGAVGTYHYEHIKYAPDFADLYDLILDYPLVVFENIEEAQDIRKFHWPHECTMLFGQESIGVSQEALDLADHIVYIPQFGSTRSLNVGTASGIAMYSYIEQWGN